MARPTIQAFAEAAEAAGSTDVDELIEALGEGEFDTVIGELTFDDKGDIEQPAYVWYEWKNGTYAEVAGQ